MVPEHRYVTIDETASMLDVSSATVRNWIRHDYLRPERRRRGVLFRYDEVRDLGARIQSGVVPRLKKRANKAGAQGTFVPEEYLGDRMSLGNIGDVLVRMPGVDGFERGMFLLAVSHVLRRVEGLPRDPLRFIGEGFRIPGKRHLGRDLESWHRDLGLFRPVDEDMRLFDVDLPDQRDALGLFYQSLLRAGSKARAGSYYTPASIVDDIALEMAEPKSGAKILDPCCGTGQFLLSFLRRTGDPGNLYGYDVDRLAVRIARINLMLAFGGYDFEPKVYHADFLAGDPGHGGGGFDVVATNPPWGLHYDRLERARLKGLFPEIGSLESFSCILKRGIDSLNEGGRLSFILPESIMHVRAHGDIRDYILRTTSIERIIRLGRVFTHVFTPVIRLDLRKGGRPGGVCGGGGGAAVTVRQERFMKNSGRVFDIDTDAEDAEIMDELFGHRHVTLKGRADWALGIVTGDNDTFLRPGRGGGEWEPIWRGRNIDHYFPGEPESCIRFLPDRFQQAAPEWKYRFREKLIYRFISKRLVVAYDNAGRLTLNSANCILPRKGEYPVKAILALFNSSPYQFLFLKRCASIKVLRGHLEGLPLPLWSDGVLARLVKMADAVLERRAGMEEVDDYIMKRFGLAEDRRRHILRVLG